MLEEVVLVRNGLNLLNIADSVPPLVSLVAKKAEVGAEAFFWAVIEFLIFGVELRSFRQSLATSILSFWG